MIYDATYAAGLTDWQYDGNATPLFAFGHALISPELYASLEHACGGMYWNATPGSACDKELVKMVRLMRGVVSTLFNFSTLCRFFIAYLRG